MSEPSNKPRTDQEPNPFASDDWEKELEAWERSSGLPGEPKSPPDGSPRAGSHPNEDALATGRATPTSRPL